ncbi:hypothetical protein K437DRAFT_293833 [Tilletiaria anomala UBC 951]|uniref:peptidylprolyl isomerase n=1 Tax=Tilletiaria anomala (strain ATCC 24038 / CBS 436.72 / UBC 951) TaxID=1037660 RepID=A0A066WBM9_TILAU|nr:uncharacterized protein K437DRAFT_293833 [Tilletiaria anomala UBC 951]KDN48494.1 hypothetical protein K437DRAFT_293833 [Tilletiaria anomala UBC 951]
MAAPPVELFALRLEPGEPLHLDPDRDFVITNICFADDEGAEDLPEGQTTIVKVHHIPVQAPFGLDDIDEDDSDFDDEEDDDEEGESDESGTAEEKQEKKEAQEIAVNGSIKEADKAPADGESDDDDDDDDLLDLDEIEEKVFSLARLTTGRVEQVTTSLQICSEELISFSLAGKNPRPVDLLGSYLAPPESYNTEPDSDEELLDDYSDEDEELDSDEEDEDEEDEDEEDDEDDSDPEVEEFSSDEDADGVIDHDELAALLMGGGDDDDSDSAEEAPERFQEIKEKPSSAASSKGKKRARTTEDDSVDAEMADASVDVPVSNEELKAAAAAEGIDLANLSKNQRKRLNKKLKAQGGAAVAPPPAAAAAAADAVTAAKKPAKTEAKQVKIAPTATDNKGNVHKVAAEAQQGGKKTTLANGLVIEDKKTGAGPQAKPGMKVGMRYIGKFKDGKIFDSNTKGAPFSFRLGKGEVIKGWDEGVKGMQVGSERRLTVPPSLGYGSKKTGPIPANSTLIFDIKCVNLK